MTAAGKPTKATAEGRAYLALQSLAKERGRPVDEYLTLYALEGFLNRLSRSSSRDRFALKGGVLLAAFDNRRPTRDVDLASIDFDNDVENMLDVLRGIAAVTVDDGLVIDIAGATAETIRDDSSGYTGVRVSFPASLVSARVNFHVDINVGDPISPAPTITAVPRILGGSIEVLGYPVEMVIAEKLVTAIERGTANTRWRDFVDMHRLAGSRTMSGAQLIDACSAVANYRRATLVPLGEVLGGYPVIAQPRWAPWRNKQQLQAETPESFAELLAGLGEFADLVLDGSAALLTWNPTARAWE